MARHIRIRMYRVGFGDCFLVSLPTGTNAHKHILVDCGVHRKGTLGPTHIQAVVDNIAQETGGHISVAIASHAHEDHISGYDKCLDSFNGFQIDEVWLPWTDNEKDPIAQKFERGQTSLARKLERHFAATEKSVRRMGAAARESREAAMDAVANISADNIPAMTALRSGFDSQALVRYLRATDTLQSPAHITGLHVDVLGPPSDDAFLRKMNPPKAERYLRLNDTGDAQTEDAIYPFGRWWTKTVDEVKANPALASVPLASLDRKAIQDELLDPSLDALAFALDQARNNTSLVLLMRFGGKVLLFPGDAQWGNWKWWLDNLDGEVTMGKVDFLKVAHHASHNASPRRAIEHLKPGAAAMVSTQKKPWKSIPRQPLLNRLGEITKKRIVRSDSIHAGNNPKAPSGPPQGALPNGFSQKEFWFDLTV